MLPKKSHDDISTADSLTNAVVLPKKATTSEISKLQAAVLSLEATSISVGINKNAIIDEYTKEISKRFICTWKWSLKQ
jgi:hypothetical protein